MKPPGSLGRLEELAIWLAGATGDPRPAVRARVVVAAADHGVSGVSAYPREVTAQMLATFLSGGGAVSVLARETGAELVCVDAGVDADTSALDVVRTGLAPSADLTREPALSPDDVTRAIDAGRDLAAQAAERRRDGPRRRRDGDRQHHARHVPRLLADRRRPARARPAPAPDSTRRASSTRRT